MQMLRNTDLICVWCFSNMFLSPNISLANEWHCGVSCWYV